MEVQWLSVALALCIRRVDPLYNIIPCPYGHPAARAVLFVKLIEKSLYHSFWQFDLPTSTACSNGAGNYRVIMKELC